MNARSWSWVSLGCNAVLLLSLAGMFRPVPRSLSASAHATRSDTTTHDHDPGSRPEPAPSPATPGGTTPFSWSELRTDDWANYRDDLRAIGCPSWTVRAIIQAGVHRNFVERNRTRMERISAQYWSFLCPPSKARLEAEDKEMRRVDDERSALLDSLFPPNEATEDPVQSGGGDDRLSFLPSRVQDQILAMRREASAAIRTIREHGDPTEEDQREIQRLVAERDAGIAALLSPEEREELQLRSSRHAPLRLLEGIDLTEAELAGIIQLREATEQQGRREGNDKKAREILEAGLQELLGEARHAEFQRAQNDEFQHLVRLGRRLNLEPDVAVSLWNLQDTLKRELDRVEKDTDRPWADRLQAAAGLEAELKRRGEALLPDDRARYTWWRNHAAWRRHHFTIRAENPIESWLAE